MTYIFNFTKSVWPDAVNLPKSKQNTLKNPAVLLKWFCVGKQENEAAQIETNSAAVFL